jgi:hypothetical protein
MRCGSRWKYSDYLQHAPNASRAAQIGRRIARRMRTGLNPNIHSWLGAPFDTTFTALERALTSVRGSPPSIATRITSDIESGRCERRKETRAHPAHRIATDT